MKTYKHLTKEERCLIYSTISRELKRNTSSTGIYYSSTAHKKYIRRKSNCHMFLCWSTKTSQIFLFKNLILNLMV
ncbi:hypothetical protein QX180_00560 [Malacoplasma iowae]|uniref:hypothetical protein n=1 Tax=Malacoplasma iowae TaxID=2116 RepID=UPI003872C58A|nr:hypothetical protein QX180_00560 [Malacoplasma iowae]